MILFFLKKVAKSSHPQIYQINNVPAFRASSQKHLGNYLDEKLNFNPFRYIIMPMCLIGIEQSYYFNNFNNVFILKLK